MHHRRSPQGSSPRLLISLATMSSQFFAVNRADAARMRERLGVEVEEKVLPLSLRCRRQRRLPIEHARADGVCCARSDALQQLAEAARRRLALRNQMLRRHLVLMRVPSPLRRYPRPRPRPQKLRQHTSCLSGSDRRVTLSRSGAL